MEIAMGLSFWLQWLKNNKQCADFEFDFCHLNSIQGDKTYPIEAA